MSTTETDTLVIAKTTKTVDTSSDVGAVSGGSDLYSQNALFIKYLILLLVVFLLIVIIGSNFSSPYYTATLPNWFPTTSTWLLLFALVFFFSAFALARADSCASFARSSWFKFMYAVVLILMLVSIFMIFQAFSPRGAFWVAIAALIVTIIAMFYIGGQSKAACGWTFPLLLLEILYLVGLWQFIQLNGY